MITADTITDEQIRELLDMPEASLYADHDIYPDARELRQECIRALYSADASVKRKARARCAEILNARAKEAK